MANPSIRTSLRPSIMTCSIPVNHSKCWACNKHNISNVQYCGCEAVVTPTRIKDQVVKYHIYSFGSLTENYGCEKLNAPFIDAAIEMVLSQHDTRVVVRTGTKHMQAILMKKHDGEVILSLHRIPPYVAIEDPAPGSDKATEFRAASEYILATDHGQTSGKTLLGVTAIK